jgi:phosphonate transport system substrate-binding protein
MYMKVTRVLALLFAFAMVVAACGDDDDTSAPPETVTSIVEVEVTVPGETVTSIVTSIVEVEVPPSTAAPDPMADWPDTLVFGFVPSRQSETLQDNVDIFADVLSDALGIRVVGVVTTDYTALGAALGTGQADMGAFGPQGYVIAQKAYGDAVELLAQSVRFGDATYHTQFFTNDPNLCTGPPEEGTFYYDETGAIVPVASDGSPQNQVGYTSDRSGLEEGVDIGLRCPEPVPLTVVAGKTISFVSETSTSGFLIPTLELEAAGVTSDQYTSIFSTASHDGSILNVYNGDADVGVSFNDARRNVRNDYPDVGSKVIVFNITGRIANDVIAVRADLPESLKDALFDAMSTYIATEEGAKVMDDIYSWTDLIRANQATADSLKSIQAACEALDLC